MPSVSNCKSKVQLATDSRPVLLIVDDDPLFRAQVSLWTSTRYQVVESKGPSKVDLDTLLLAEIVVLDLNMPDKDGIEFLRTLGTLSPPPKLLIASAYDHQIIKMAKRTAELYGIVNTSSLQKPVCRSTFSEAIDKLSLLTNNIESPVSSQAGRYASEEEILAGIRKREFITYYQPQIRLSDKSVTGIEALARWDHPEFGILTPNTFNDTVERPEIATDFTLLMLESALIDYKNLNRIVGYQGHLSVNVPPEVFAVQDFADRLLNIVRRFNFPTKNLVCEITERGMEKLDPEITASLTRLKMHGVQLSVDDFGTGQSGLSKLRFSTFDEIKIDQTFIKNLSTSPKSRLITESILTLAAQIGLRVVAEGIEDQETQTWLHQRGCQIAQGYYFSRPLPAEKLADWIRECKYASTDT